MFPFQARQSRSQFLDEAGNVVPVSQSQHTRANPFDCLSTHATYNRDTLGTCDDGLAASELQRFWAEGFAPRTGGTKVQKPRAGNERSGSAPEDPRAEPMIQMLRRESFINL